MLVQDGRQAKAGFIAPWCNSPAKRTFDLACGSALLLVALPIMVVAAILIKVRTPGPVWFRHRRLGKDGGEIEILKFRTMTHAATDSGPGVTRQGDQRVTPLGRVLRKWKIDELPQLVNVLRGEMSMVGPRPDNAKYLERMGEDGRRLLALKPGLTSPATLAFRHEEQLLARVPEEQLESFYCSEVLPEKVRLELEYGAKASFAGDIELLLRTAGAVLLP